MTGTLFSATHRRLRWALPFLAILLLCGCPYSTEEPLSDPATAVIDPALAGTWRMRDEDSGEWQRLVFLPFNDHELVAYAPVEKPGEATLCRLFVTVIGSERFLNIQELGTAYSGWYFARYMVDGDRLVLRLIDDGLFETRGRLPPQERRELIQAHLADPLLYAPVGYEPADMILERAEGVD